MDEAELQELARKIVERAKALKDSRTDEKEARVSYCCIFSQASAEYEELVAAAGRIGQVVKDTPTGPIFLLRTAISTSAGSLRILKIRKPDPTRLERGDADFSVSNYPEFRGKVLRKEGFAPITRPEAEMIELASPEFPDVRAYFSDPPVDVRLPHNEFLLRRLAEYIVERAKALKDSLVPAERLAPVGYCCIYCQTLGEFEELISIASGMGGVTKETPTGPFFLLAEPIPTSAGSMRILKIRKPDATHPERGHADFTPADYQKLKGQGLAPIVHNNYEIIELVSPKFKDVRAYFPNPPIEKILGL